MKQIENQEFGGERPLYKERDLQLRNVTIHVGESSLKETRNIAAVDCRFEGKYVFWECHDFSAVNCFFDESARSSLWYSKNGRLTDCQVECPKMFRRMQGIVLENCQFTKAQETLWDCDTVRMSKCSFADADYFGVHTNNVKMADCRVDGNYNFQYSHDVEISNCLLNSKDALWESENVTVVDSVINGEYLGWYSKNLTLIRCHITGEQPLCYCENLVMEDCTMGADTILAFEYSTIEATIDGDVPSIKNPTSGHISVKGHVGEIIIDQNQKQPANCVIA